MRGRIGSFMQAIAVLVDEVLSRGFSMLGSHSWQQGLTFVVMALQKWSLQKWSDAEAC